MTIETIYIANDGVSFFTEADCLAHEMKTLVEELYTAAETNSTRGEITLVLEALQKTHNITKKTNQ